MTKGQILTYLKDVGVFRRLEELEKNVEYLEQEICEVSNELHDAEEYRRQK